MVHNHCIILTNAMVVKKGGSYNTYPGDMNHGNILTNVRIKKTIAYHDTYVGENHCIIMNIQQ